MRTAIYARYSSDLQDARSIDDQVREARAHASKQGWEVIEVYRDDAISGASMVNRRGLQAMMKAAEAGQIKIVLTESMDRLSRDLADSAAIHRQLAYWGVPIITLADGEMDKTRVAIKGLVGSIFLDDLRQKVKRGQKGRLQAGRIPGGRCYGYDVPKGEERGLRTINQDQAAIINRIFREYLEGRGPIDIVADLNREGVSGPRGGKWNASTIIGSRKRGTGILNNTLYIGKFRFERLKYVKDPTDGKRQSRLNQQAEWVEREMPELRIVSDELWEAVQAVRASRATTHPVHQRRPQRVLSGLLRCGVCSGTYIVTQGPYVGCSANRNSKTCDNNRLMKMGEIEGRVMEALRTHLLSPERIELAVERYRKEREDRTRAAAKDRRSIERELADVKVGLRRVMDMVVAGIGEQAELGEEMKKLAARKRELEAMLPSMEKATVTTMHPAAAKRYAKQVEDIQEALTRGGDAGEEAVKLVRCLIDRIVITPQPDRMDLQVFGDLAMLLGNPLSSEGELNNAKAGCGGWI
jgi:site-specific DNA recombinase